jgi:hypothetical protein
MPQQRLQLPQAAGTEGKLSVMKCLLISDLHYALKQFDWVMTMA